MPYTNARRASRAGHSKRARWRSHADSFLQLVSPLDCRCKATSRIHWPSHNEFHSEAVSRIGRHRGDARRDTDWARSGRTRSRLDSARNCSPPGRPRSSTSSGTPSVCCSSVSLRSTGRPPTCSSGQAGSCSWGSSCSPEASARLDRHALARSDHADRRVGLDCGLGGAGSGGGEDVAALLQRPLCVLLA